MTVSNARPKLQELPDEILLRIFTCKLLLPPSPLITPMTQTD
jgi:hypothetical protein